MDRLISRRIALQHMALVAAGIELGGAAVASAAPPYRERGARTAPRPAARLAMAGTPSSMCLMTHTCFEAPSPRRDRSMR